jgi:hypothetical protein
MQRFCRAVLCASIFFGAFATSASLRAQVQHVNFDDVTGSGVRPIAFDRYRDQGLLFSVGANLFTFGPSSFANTAPNWLYASQTPAGSNADAPITMRFVAPDGTNAITDDFSFSIADGDHLGPWTVHAFDLAGVQQALVTGTTADRVRLSGKQFHRVVFTPSQDFDGIDSLAFNRVVRPDQIAITTPVAYGKSWRYLHPTTNVDPATTDTDFNTTWFKDDGSYNGPAFSNPAPSPLGYGTINYRALATNIGTPASGSRYSAYFTTTFEIDDADLIRTLAIDLLADDGAFVYLNGQLVVRHNIVAGGTDLYRTLAADTVVNGVGTEEGTFTFEIDRALLRSGTNFLAVSVHNDAAASSDLGFDLRMSASLTVVPEPASVGLLAAAAMSFAAAARFRTQRTTNRTKRLPRGGGERFPISQHGQAVHDSLANRPVEARYHP